ncbi:hypothetical protein [Actinokineospora enzanensis]|uniref:hypothetical protein n=1 Tax=Actinokineospora enzanensis TaxID=155975 RepID=UPI000370AD96|nr:hypothetical protein [Actinokineospora enzanensis]
MVTDLEAHVIAALAAAIRTAALTSPAFGPAAEVARTFTGIARAGGLTTGLVWLTTVIRATPDHAGLTAVLDGLRAAVESEESPEVIRRALAEIQSAVHR